MFARVRRRGQLPDGVRRIWVSTRKTQCLNTRSTRTPLRTRADPAQRSTSAFVWGHVGEQRVH
eukprot:41724-Lingulodinium_polyedra.AAC.1